MAIKIEKIKLAISNGNMKQGSLQFWGEWFGRPYDNIHTIVDAELGEGDALVCTFDQREKLSVWNPTGLYFDKNVFRVTKASKILWQWYYYGNPQDDLHFIQYEERGNNILVSEGKVGTGFSKKRILDPTGHYAVELH